MDTTMREEGKFFRWLLNVGRHSSGLGGITCVFISATSRFPKKELNIVILLFPPKKYRKRIFFGQGLFRVRRNRGAGLYRHFWGKGKKTSSFSSIGRASAVSRSLLKVVCSFSRAPPLCILLVVEEREGGGMGRFSLSSSLPGPCTYICDPLFGGVGGKHRNRMGGGEEVFFLGGMFSISSGRKAEGKRETKKKKKRSSPQPLFWGI